MSVQAICSYEPRMCCTEQIAQILPHQHPLRRAIAIFQRQSPGNNDVFDGGILKGLLLNSFTIVFI